MTRLPMVASRTMISFLKSLGFKKIRQHGSHIFFRHSDGRTVTVSDHKGEDLGRGRFITAFVADSGKPLKQIRNSLKWT